jgi:hypothetical protein
MTSEEKTLSLFETRVRELIIRFNTLKEENDGLRTEIEEKNSLIKQMNDEMGKSRNAYNNLMMARMIEISDGDMESAKSKLSKLIRNVNKCIAILKDE